MGTRSPALLFLLLLAAPAVAAAAQPLVDSAWLAANLDREDLLVMDLQPEAAYRQYHIPGAVHSDYGRWRRPDAKGTKQMLPPAADLESLIGGLGVGPGIHVVLVVTGRGPGEMGGGASFHSPANLRRIYRAAGVPPTGDQIVFCHTGHRAALAWFVTHELLGNSGARLYDGSTAEWAADPALPMERKIDLE